MSGPRRLGELADLCRAELRGAGPDQLVTGVASLADAGPGELAFYANPAYRPHLATTRAAAILVAPNDSALPELAGRVLLVCSSPYAAFAKASAVFHPPAEVVPGIDARACVEPGAEVDASAQVEAFAYVGAGAQVGPGAVLMVGAYVGAGAKIGANTRLYPHAVVRERCVVGSRCILHSGAVVGADGFGFAFDPAGDGEGPVHRKVPQAGIARLEDDVELGANSCVDRATLGETVVGRGAKLDNLIQVAHNVKIGPLCVIAAQAGIAGSTTIGLGVMIGGQAGLIGHIAVGDLAKIGAQSGILRDVEPGQVLQGSPAREGRRWLKTAAAADELPELLREVRRLRARVARLEANGGGGGPASE